MKCAIEFYAMKALAEEKFQKEEKEKDLEAMEAFKIMEENAIRLCDVDIDRIMSEQALNRKALKIGMTISIREDRLGNIYFQVVSKDGLEYANGEPSYAALGPHYALDKFKSYLEEHCFSVTITNCYYREKGIGNRIGKRVEITARPECAG